ncbi:hypothetical protein LTS03_005825 [Exophiala xenobiotica]|nr:hypothetical protein LTS06_010331 [Exophiala xenobiotica]KAK5257100.1 hypothetical protein LTR40_009792 [Exophiala xenobiotica]KAK5347736.1 hypothetical protein LTR61_008693 [Exophiala xenobiotica]KAK5372139.1 hypothetical protein LTR11_006261 [Exophiala xenobiotica]KAK5375271.1 hypothetical protein LTS03_005825 [Exophiala xenobiotica]
MGHQTDGQVAMLAGRAQTCAAPDAIESPLWDVVNDLWEPENNPNGYVSLGIAENSLMHHELEQHIANNLRLPLRAFTYGDGPLGSKRLRNAVAQFLNRRLKPVSNLRPKHIIITNGVSHAIEHTSWAFCNPGDGFLLGRPYYGAFLPDISLRPGVETVTVPFDSVDPMSVEAVHEYESAILAAKERGVTKHQIHLVSDEIYAFSVWKNNNDTSPPPVDFISVLSIPSDGIIDPSLLHVLWGVSKDFGANGLRLGCIISQSNEAFRKALLSVAIYSYASSVSEHIVANVLEDDAWVDKYIQTNQERLAGSYSFVVEFLQKHAISYLPGANAAFFICVDLGKAYLDRHQERDRSEDVTGEVMQLLLENKVFLTSGSYFGAEQPGMFRLVFSQQREVLEEGLKRILRAIS